MSIPWAEIELDWKAGVLSVKEICAKHFVGENRLRKVAKDRCWTRTPRGSVVVPIAAFPYTLDDIRRAYETTGPGGAAARFKAPLDAMALLGQDEGWLPPPDTPPSAEEMYPVARGASWVTQFDSEDVKKAGLLASAAVLSKHRSDIAQLRNLTGKMVEGLSALMSGGEAPDFPVLGAKESVADLLGKLTVISGKVIDMERVAYGLNVETQDQKEVDAYAKMDPVDRRRKIDELLARTRKANNA